MSRQKFIYDGGKFVCPLVCGQCEAKSRTGQRCRLRTCRALPYCWIHTRMLLKIRVGKSCYVQGGGLFAWNPREKKKPLFKPNDMIAPYIGERVTMQELDRRYGEDGLAPYALADSVLPTQDAACKRGIGAWANAPEGLRVREKQRQKGRQNAALNAYDGKYYLFATRNIRHGEEILVNYGNTYFKDGGKPHKTTHVKPKSTKTC